MPFLKIITIFAFFQVVGIRLSDMYFIYSLAKALAMVSSPAFNVSMSASTSHVVTDGTSLGYVRIVTVWSLS